MRHSTQALWLEESTRPDEELIKGSYGHPTVCYIVQVGSPEQHVVEEADAVLLKRGALLDALYQSSRGPGQ